MKIKLITLAVVVLLSACSKEIELDQLQTRGNLVYEVNATSPFTGTVKEQYVNGQVKLKSTYKKGEKNGTHVEYYENGELKFNAKYKSGQLEGKYEEYFPNQILKKSGELVKGTGSEFHYNKNSELYRTISYENHIVTYNYHKLSNKTKIQQTIRIISNALKFFRLDNFRYPTNEEGLMALVSAPAGLSEWNGPYLDAAPKDAWNRPFLYFYPGDNGKEFDVYTLGADGVKGGENDNRDWGNWNF